MQFLDEDRLGQILGSRTNASEVKDLVTLVSIKAMRERW
jgi:hypothetical protein